MPKIHSAKQFRFFGVLAGRGVKWARNATRGKKKSNYSGGGRKGGKRKKK
jgi:hypothetical protein